MEESELEGAVRALVDRASGLAGSEFKKELGAEYKRHEKRAVEIAEDLAARGEIHRWSAQKKVRFFREDPLESVARAAFDALGAGALTEAELKHRVEGKGRGLGDLLKEWMKGAQGRGELYPYSPRPGSRVKRFGREPDVATLLKKVLAELRKAVSSAAGQRVQKARILEAIAGELGVAAASGASSMAAEERPVSSATDWELFLGALGDLARERGTGLLSVRELRSRTPLDKPRFDRAALELSREGKVILHHHDFPGSLSEADRQSLVVDERGTHYVGVAPRRIR